MRLKLQKHDYEVEPEIKPLVEAMNKTGVIRTVGSCHGHWNGSAPYVYFKAPIGIAAAMEKLLRVTDEREIFRFAWDITAMFDMNHQLIFRLSSQNFQEKLYSFQNMLLFWRFRKHLDEELWMLALIFNEMLFVRIDGAEYHE